MITLDGTATIVALPAIGHDLSATMARLQWVVNAPLLVLAALLLPAGTLADRYGRGRLIRIGLTVFAVASIACSMSQSDEVVIAGRLVQGAGGALLLPACLAVLRATSSDVAERARLFGIWAAWTGAASAVGPLMAGALVELVSWRALFVVTAVGAGIALRLLGHAPPVGAPPRHVPLPGVGTVSLALLLGAVAYGLMQTAEAGLTPALGWPVALAFVSGLLLVRDRHRHALLPRELLVSRNCVPANATTFAFYFGMFGVSFLVVLYVQQVLRYSAMWGAIVMLPTSLMLLLAERFGRLTPVFGTRALIVTGALLAAAGIGWMGARSHPLPFWSHIIVGTALFGLGLSVAASALTHAAVAAVPETYAGAASGLNHAVVRAAGLVAVALLGSIAAPGVAEMVSAEGVQRAMILCALVVGIGGVWGSALLRDEAPGGLGKK